MPNRILKESICTSDTIAALQSSDAEVLFYRLLVIADDFGCFDGRVEIVRARCYPLSLLRATDKRVAEWLADLERVGLLLRYSVDGRDYICLTKWVNHQRLRDSKRRYPEPPINNLRRLAAVGGDSPPDRKPESELESEFEPESGSGDGDRKIPPAPSADGLALAEHAFGLVSQNHPNIPSLKDRKRRTAAWAKDVDRFLRSSGKTAEECRAFFDWLAQDKEQGPARAGRRSWGGWSQQFQSVGILTNDHAWAAFGSRKQPVKSHYD